MIGKTLLQTHSEDIKKRVTYNKITRDQVNFK